MRRSRLSACLLGALAVTLSACHLATPSRCRADEVLPGKPYKLTVVLDVAKNRVLTDVFRQQVERELREGLQAALGDLARVDVRSDHPRLAEVRARGLGRALDAWQEVSDTKTHFVLISLVNNEYEIQARQHDGPTGTAGPVVRTGRTADRAYVARAAALLIEQDFGFTAGFRDWPRVKSVLSDQPQPVKLHLQGAGLGVPLARWVRQGDVFAIVQTFRGGKAPVPVPWALVRIQDPPGEGNDACTGHLFWRYRPPDELSNHEGYRCVKLGTVKAPVRLRFVEQKDKAAGPVQAARLSVEVRRVGFWSGDGGVVTDFSDPTSGVFSTAHRKDVEPYDGVAFVTVKGGGLLRALLPLPLVDDQPVTVVVAPVTVDLAAEARARRSDLWKREVNVAWLTHVEIFRELQDMGQKPNTPREKIVERAREGLQRTRDDYERLFAEKEELLRDPTVKQADLAGEERFLGELKKGEQQLQKFVTEQQAVLQEENKPEKKAARAKIIDAGLAEDKAEYEQAIKLYDEALGVIEAPAVKKHLEELRAAWEPRGDNHKKARAFIYNRWPDLDTIGLDTEMEKAKKALQDCMSVGDTLSPRKLLLAAQTHVSQLAKEAALLNARVNEDDVKPAKRIARVTEKLQELIRDTVAYLKTAAR